MATNDIAESNAVMLLGLLIGKQIYDIFHDKWTFGDRKNMINVLKCYYETNPNRGFISITCIIIVSLAFQYHGNGISIASAVLFIVTLLASLIICISPKGHSQVEISQVIEEDRCNIGRSLAMNFLINYLEKILITLPEALASYEINVNDNPQDMEQDMEHDAVPLDEGDQQKPITVLKKLFILIPKSGNNNFKKLEEVDDKLEFLDTVLVATVNLGGKKKREYRNTVYRFKQKDFSSYHFVAEFATPLTSIYKVQKLTKKCGRRMAADQVEIFYNSLVELLQKNKRKYGEICCPVLYDDKLDTLSSVLYQEITKVIYNVPQFSSNDGFLNSRQTTM